MSVGDNQVVYYFAQLALLWLRICSLVLNDAFILIDITLTLLHSMVIRSKWQWQMPSAFISLIYSHGDIITISFYRLPLIKQSLHFVPDRLINLLISQLDRRQQRVYPSWQLNLFLFEFLPKIFIPHIRHHYFIIIFALFGRFLYLEWGKVE